MDALDRVGAFSGAAFVLLGNVGNSLAQVGLPDVPTGQEVLDADLRIAGSMPAQLGLSVELLAFTSFLAFIAFVYTRGREAGWLAVAGVAGGVAAVAIKLGAVAPEIAIYLLRDSMDPATALALERTALVSYFIFTLVVGLFLVGGAGAAMMAHRLGPVLGWGGIAIGFANGIYVLVIGPRIDSGFSPTFLVAMLWILVVSAVWGFSRTRTTSEPAKVAQRVP